MLKKITCDTIGGLDNGLFGRLVDAELDKIVNDLDDRGHDGNKRSLTITIEFGMDMKRDPHSPSVTVDPRVKAKLPDLRSGVTAAKVSTKDGELQMIFRDDNRDNVDQGTIYDDAEESK